MSTQKVDIRITNSKELINVLKDITILNET